jgi:hypothetical protein
MKKLMWVLVIFIAVAFGVTATMTDVLRIMRQRLLWFGRDDGVEDDSIWEYLAHVEEARRTGIVVSDREVVNLITARYRVMRKYDSFREESDTPEEYMQISMAYERLTPQQKQAELENIDFNEVDYSRLVTNMLELTIREFERMCREELQLSKLYSFVTGSALAASQSVYDKFLEENHQRKIDYIHLNSENYAGKVQLNEEGLEELYEERKVSYKEPARVAFEYVMARFDDVKDSLPAPSEEELKDFYERKKRMYFWDESSEPSELPGTERPLTPEEKYKPYDEVREEVLELYLTDQSEKKAQELVAKASERINSLEEINLLEAARIASEDGLAAGESKPFASSEPWKLEDEFGRCMQASRMDTESIGGEFKGPHNCDKGVFFYRLSKHLPEHYRPLAEVRDEIEKTYINLKAGKAAREEAERIVEEARKAKSFNDPLLLKEKVARVSTGFFKSLMNQGNIETIEGIDADVIGAAFAIKKIGDIPDPVVINVAGKTHYYLVQYKGRKDPRPAEFLDKRLSLLGALRRENQRKIFGEWREDLLQRANIQKLYLKGKEKQPEDKEQQPGAEEEQPPEEKGS